MALDPHRRSASSESVFGSSGSSGLRIGDAEREQAVQALGEHLRAGRLSVVEYDERLEQAFAARTEAELTPLFADLPGGSPRSALSPPPGRSERRPRTMAVPIRLVVILALIVAAIVATAVTAFPVLLLIPVLWFVLRHRFGPRHRYGPRRRYDYAGPRRY
jgi:Domain of unknown function (DUF1707)